MVDVVVSGKWLVGVVNVDVVDVLTVLVCVKGKN